MTTPPLANAAATIAICIGVTTRLAWPIAVRAGSIGAFGELQLARAGADGAGGRELIGRVVERRNRVEPEALEARRQGRAARTAAAELASRASRTRC